MKRYRYICKLLSEVVISSATATEGFHKSLDHLPGAKFLGIAAGKLYDEHVPATLDLFHNGKVRFGDAYPLIGEEVALPVPFSWFHNKGGGLGDETLYLHHNLKQDDHKALTAKGYQLKQARNGYFVWQGRKFLDIEQDFAIRSAYNADELRADDGKMFGYFALPAGTTWTFTVEDDTDQHGEAIKKALEGKKRIGRSRSAEYGLVEITFQGEESVATATDLPAGTTLVFAQSNLCFLDSFGRPTLRPEAEALGFPTGSTIDWEKSQVRSRLYQTWNRKRNNRDADRMIILKGSVLVVEHPVLVQSAAFAKGIGTFRSEGFGQVLLNPKFLISKGYELQLGLTKLYAADWVVNATGHVQTQSPPDQVVIDFLKQRRKQDQNLFNLDKAINDFLSSKDGQAFKGLSSSQWGTVRAYAKHASTWEILEKLLFNETIGAFYRGQSEKEWREKARRDKLKVFLASIHLNDRISATLKLAAEMAKRSRSNRETAQTTPS
ncbi:MAG: hypothetical protein OHK0039_10280 [Bacteroidia bacterium]